MTSLPFRILESFQPFVDHSEHVRAMIQIMMLLKIITIIMKTNMITITEKRSIWETIL